MQRPLPPFFNGRHRVADICLTMKIHQRLLVLCKVTTKFLQVMPGAAMNKEMVRDIAWIFFLLNFQGPIKGSRQKNIRMLLRPDKIIADKADNEGENRHPAPGLPWSEKGKTPGDDNAYNGNKRKIPPHSPTYRPTHDRVDHEKDKKQTGENDEHGGKRYHPTLSSGILSLHQQAKGKKKTVKTTT